MADRTLILLRHAKSDWSGDEPDDFRPLATRGRRQAPEAGRWLAGNVERIDLAVVSPAVRARTTWELAAAELAAAPEVSFDERVYAASAGQLLHLVRRFDDRQPTVVLVGHNPGLEDLVHRLTGEWVEMVTSAIAVIDLSGGWAETGEGAAATLRTSGRPPPAAD